MDACCSHTHTHTKPPHGSSTGIDIITQSLGHVGRYQLQAGLLQEGAFCLCAKNVRLLQTHIIITHISYFKINITTKL